ncbi:hypothetical protein ACJ41O_005833 [Fusarium nematophilum]
MKHTVYLLVALFIAITSATFQPIRRTANFSSAATRILLGSPEHVHVADFCPSSSTKLSLLLDKEVVGSPSWMALAPPNRLYAVDEFSANLRLFELDPGKGELTLMAEKEASSGVVHLQFNADKTRLIGSAYGNGSVDVWNIENGDLNLMKSIASPGKPGPDKGHQTAPHPHQANLDPTGRFIAINDLGTDSIIIIDAKDDAYRVANNIRVIPGGCGPRHSVFYPQGADRATHYIVVCEISNQAFVYSLEYHDDYLAFKQVQSISTFGADFPPANKTSAAAGAILLASNNRDLYISNRLTGNETDSIAHFSIAASNCGSPLLSFASTRSTEGLVPRTIALSEDERYIIIGNQGGGFGLVILKREADGTLEENPTAIMGAPSFGPQFVQQIV